MGVWHFESQNAHTDFDAGHRFFESDGYATCKGHQALIFVGVEVKNSRPERARLLRQVDKYLACAEVDALIVVSQRAISLPAACRGKPVILFTLNRLWGVSLP